MFVDKGFTKENLDYYLKELAKEFRKRNGKNTPAEIVLVGGAAILVNYGFREMTYDIDAVITASSAMKEAVNAVGDRFGLPNGWLNADFKSTSSYSSKLSQYSKYYRTYSNVLMSIDAFEKREQMLQLRARVLQAEQERMDGEPTMSVSEARKRLGERAGEV